MTATETSKAIEDLRDHIAEVHYVDDEPLNSGMVGSAPRPVLGARSERCARARAATRPSRPEQAGDGQERAEQPNR